MEIERGTRGLSLSISVLGVAHAYRPALDDPLDKPSAWHAEGTEGVIGAGFVMGFVVCLLLLGGCLVRPQKHAKSARL